MACGEKREIKVRCTPDDNAENGFRFEMFENGAPIGNEITCAKSKGMKKSDHHEFLFNLENCNGAGLRFVAVPDDAMWVNKQMWIWPVSCPRWKASHEHIEPRSVSEDRMTLTVWNHNPKKSNYKFALNFVTNTDPEKSVSYDPIWHNQNGGAD